MMRKVQVFKFEKQVIDGFTRRVKVPDFIGTFHQFGASYEEFETGAGNFTTLIIERDDGTIHEGMPHLCQFIAQPAGLAQSDAIIAAIHREETPGILADLNARLKAGTA